MTRNIDRFPAHSPLPVWWPYVAHGWLLLAALTTLGCAGAGSQVIAESPANLSTTALPGPIVTGPATVTAPMGLFRLQADPATGTATLTPIAHRAGADFTAGDSAIPDLTKLFTDPAGLCGDCLQLDGIGYDPIEDEIWFDVEVTHPIPVGRPELSAFDMQLLLVSDLPSQPILTYTGILTSHPPYLANAEGYTSQLTASLEAALGSPLSVDLFPFVNVAVDDTPGNFAGTNVNGFADVTAPSGYNVFSSGESDTVQLRLDASALSSIDMVLALSGSFYRSYTSKGSNLFQKNNPVYFVPEANRKEAWRVLADVKGSALKAGDTNSVAVLDLTIRDWQNGLSGVLPWNPLEPLPANQNRGSIPLNSHVVGIEVDIPGVLAFPLNVDVFNNPHTGDGMTAATPLVYNITIPNSGGAPAGTYPGLIRVLDTRLPELTGVGNGDVLFQDGVTFGQLFELATYALIEVEVADDYVFVGNDFDNTGTRIARTGATVTATGSYFAGVGATVSNAAIDGNAVYVVSSGPAFSGNGRVQNYNLATGALQCEYVFSAGENPFDVALLGNDEVYVTGFLSDDVFRINLDPTFVGTRLTDTIDLSSYADPGFLARPQEIHTMPGGRVFVAGAHLNAGFTAAPAGLLFELNPATNVVVQAVDTTGLRNCWSLAEYPGGTSIGVFGPGTYTGDGGSGRFNLGTNLWTVDLYPAGLAWTECAFTSTGRVFLSDAFTATLAHIGLPFSGTINHQIDVLPPPVPPFPFLSTAKVGRGDYLYAGEFAGTVRVWDASAATATTPPTVIDTLTITGGVDALGVQE